MKRIAHLVAAGTLLLALFARSLHTAAQTPNKAGSPGKPGAETPREIRLPNRGLQHGMCPVFTADGASLFWWDGKSISIWDLEKEEVADRIEPSYWQFVVSQDGKKLATHRESADNKLRTEHVIKIYDVATRRELHELSRPPGGDPKGGVFAACGFDRTAGKLFTRTDVDLQVWDMKTGKMLRRINTQKAPHDNMSSQSPDGRYLTMQNGQANVHVLDTQSEAFVSIRTSNQDLGIVLGRPRGGYISSLGSWSFSGDGRTLCGTEQINGAWLEWSLPQAKMTNGVRISGLVFARVSRDMSRILASYGGEEQKILRVLDRKTQRVLATLGPLDKDMAWYAISPDNRWVFGSSVGDTRLWDLGAAKPAKK
jgi:WD40 repeat protein